MNQENQLIEQNDETEIDLLEIYYLLKAKLKWLILAFVIGFHEFDSEVNCFYNDDGESIQNLIDSSFAAFLKRELGKFASAPNHHV